MIVFATEFCVLSQQDIIGFALAAAVCPVMDYTLTTEEGLPLPDTLYADRYEYCKPVLLTYTCEDGRSYEMTIFI